MQAFMRMGAESHETGRLPGEDGMSNKTSVISPAEGPPTHGPWGTSSQLAEVVFRGCQFGMLAAPPAEGQARRRRNGKS
jgi:hypothetical protein